MTADVELLPLPNSGSGFYEDDVWHDTFSKRQMEAYARAYAAHATAAKDAEIERLRAEVERLEIVGRLHSGGADLAINAVRAAEARAERLAEALQWYVDNDDTNDRQEGNEFWLAGRDRARALLRDQEVENG